MRKESMFSKAAAVADVALPAGRGPAVRHVTGADRPEDAQALAMAAAKRGDMVLVCAWCVTEAPLQRALAGFSNVSHGCCAACTEKALGEFKEGRAA